jgi:hypothetical protein
LVLDGLRIQCSGAAPPPTPQALRLGWCQALRESAGSRSPKRRIIWPPRAFSAW